MKILLIAYDFPPIPSPQSLRWAYLARELALAGHEVHVLAPDVPGYGAGGLPELVEGMRVHRVFPGPLMGYLARRQRRRASRMLMTPPSTPRALHQTAARSEAVPGAAEVPGSARRVVEKGDGSRVLHRPGKPPVTVLPYAQLNWKGRVREVVLSMPVRLRAALAWTVRAPFRGLAAIGFRRRLQGAGRRMLALRPRLVGQGLNWKGQLAEAAKSFLSLWMFPDARAEWMPWARRLLDRVLREHAPDVVITSHEPANSIELGLHAKRKGYRWIADLGDPVLAPYTPPRWRKRARSLERALCRQADYVTVTSVRAAETLRERHGLEPRRCVTVTQGFDARFSLDAGESHGVELDPKRVELLYTGSFYSFRQIGDFLAAVIATDGVRLNVASIVAPPEVALAAREHPQKVRLLGFLPHRQAIFLQRQCDVLVNLANKDPVQIPGKLYEYLGAGVRILHIGGSPDDAASELVRASGTGVRDPNDFSALTTRLESWVEEKRKYGSLSPLPRTDFDLNEHSWERLAGRVAELAASTGMQ